MNRSFNRQELSDFISKAAKATYAGGGKPVKNPERPGFVELVYPQGDFSYRDSYTGFYRSRGMEVVRFEGNPVWSSSYGGGIIGEDESIANQTFGFLKKAMSSEERGFDSFRGPHLFKEGDWEYVYKQDGDVFEFSGYEEIYYKSKLIFFHRMIGGVIRR